MFNTEHDSEMYQKIDPKSLSIGNENFFDISCNMQIKITFVKTYFSVQKGVRIVRLRKKFNY